jgi:hypothetical protein
VRLCLALEVLHRIRASHGRISARAIQVLGASCESGGFFLDGVDLAEDAGYHSPERLAGGPACPEDDTWAVGVLLYYALTGAKPFGGDTPGELLAQIRKFRPAPLFRLGFNLPNLQSVIDDVLCRDARRRIRTVTELRARLVKALPSTRELTVLKLGKPELSILADEATDGDGVKLTGVADREQIDRQIRDVLQRRDSFRRAATRAGLAEEDSEGLPTQQIHDRRAEPTPRSEAATRSGSPREGQEELPTRPSMEPPPSVELGLSWDDLPESQVPSSARVPTSGPEPLGVGVWADEESEIEVSHGSVASVPMAEGTEDTTRVRLGTASPRAAVVASSAGGGARGPGPQARSVGGAPRGSGEVPSVAPAAKRPAVQAHLSLDTHDSTFGTEGQSPWRRVAAAAAFVAIGGMAAYLLLGPRSTAPRGAAPTSAATAPAEGPPGAGSAAAEPTDSLRPGAGSRTAGPAPSANVSGSAAAGADSRFARRGDDVTGCVSALFPKGAFNKSKPKLDVVCTERDARKGAKALNVALVHGAGPGVLTQGMREWAQLSWYEMALFAAARAACCQAPVALSTRTGADACALDRALERLGQAAAWEDDVALGKAIEAFRETATCLLRQGGAGAYVQRGLPGRAATAAFKRFVARLGPAAGR